MIRPPPISPPFPYTTLFRSPIIDLAQALNAGQVETLVILGGNPVYDAPADLNWAQTQRKAKTVVRLGYSIDETFGARDRKSTRLNSSHLVISYAVFCLKKKK